MAQRFSSTEVCHGEAERERGTYLYEDVLRYRERQGKKRKTVRH